MQASSSVSLAVPARPASAARSVVVDAVSMAQAVLGAPAVTLRGFGASSAVAPPWTHPFVPYLGAPDDPLGAIETIQAQRRSFRGLLLLVAPLLGVFCFAAGAIFSTLKLPSTLSRDAAMSWTVVDVQAAGLVVATTSGRAVIPVGGRLPNGEAVLAVGPANKSAVLSSGTLLLNRAALPIAR